MKVQGPGSSQGASKSGKSKKNSNTSSGDGGFDALVGSSSPQESQGSAGAGATHSIAQVDALLALQGAEDPTQGAAKKRMRFRAGKILDMLDNLRAAMLGGELTVGHMVDVADVVASHREKITDPGLTAIMDEIDLRAQVELAKMRMALERAEKNHNNISK